MITSPRKACGLVRVSSEEQAKGGYGLEFQEEDIRTFCTRNNLDLIKVCRDEGYSGSTAARPGFQEMMAYARDKCFDVLVVWKLDRLFRDTKLTLQTVDELNGLGIEFRSVQETFTHDSNGRFLLTIFAAGAEKERKDIALRMHSGRIAAAKRGIWISGGGMPPFGYRYNQTTKRLEIDQDEARVVRQLFGWLVNEKLSLYKIQSRINEMKVPTKFDRMGRRKTTGSTGWWSKRTIGRIVSNEVYTGTFTFRKYTRLGSVRKQTNLRPKEDWIIAHSPPIISPETYQKAKEQLARNAENSPRKTKAFYLLSKLLICAHDNRRMQSSTRPAAGTQRECKYYFCTGSRKGFAAVRCPSSSVSESRIAPPVWAKLKNLLTNPATVLNQLREYQVRTSDDGELAEKRASLQAQKTRAERRQSRVVELYLSGAIGEERFRSEHAGLKRQIEDVSRELKKLESSEVSHEEMLRRIRSVDDLYTSFKARLDNASDETKREILQRFVKSVVVRGEELNMEVMLPSPESFAGQATQPLSCKDSWTVFLKAKLLPVADIWRSRRLHENFKGRDGTLPRRQEKEGSRFGVS